MELFLTTPQFAKRVGVTKNTVVNWEQKGLISPHHVSPTGRRFYSLEQVNDILSGKAGVALSGDTDSGGSSEESAPDG